MHNALTKKDHIKTTFKANAFHVNAAYTRPESVSIESQNLFSYIGNHEENIGFLSAIQPIINE
jgi:hypothetical protein